jgi:hypothetical protein
MRKSTCSKQAINTDDADDAAKLIQKRTRSSSGSLALAAMHWGCRPWSAGWSPSAHH